MTYASGKNAWGISDRSGRRYRLRDMKVEWTGAKVGPDEFDPKHPQLFPPKAAPDPQALRNPRPEPQLNVERAIQHGFNPVGFAEIPGITPANNLAPVGEVGTVTVNALTGTSEVAAVSGVPTIIGSVGQITGPTSATHTLTGLVGTGGLGSAIARQKFTVTVANPGSGNKYYIDGTLTPTLTLTEGSTFFFDWTAASGHPLRFSTTSDGTHGGGSEYTTGVTVDTSGYTTTITVASGAPTLYYYCQYHSGMGGQANTP